MHEILKLHHNLDALNGDSLYWYTGLYLCLPRVFMSIVRNKLVNQELVKSVLVPVHIVKDPVTDRQLSINITDRYFFVGTSKELQSEEDIGLQTHINTITLLRNREDSYKPTKITLNEIKQVIHTHLSKRKNTIQEDITVYVIGGTFRDWYGTVQKKVDPETVRIRFTSDDYEYITNMPTALCKIA